MKVYGLWTAAVIGGAGLVAVIAITAVSSVDGAPRGRVVAPPAPAVTTREPAVWIGDCSPGGGVGPSSIRLEGPCHGLLTGRFACVHDGELQTLSIRRPLAAGRAFYLTIVLTEFEGPGDYSQDIVSAQVVGPPNTPRWTSLGSRTPIRVTRDGTFELGDGVLLPEPGTPASGVITLRGRAVCR